MTGSTYKRFRGTLSGIVFTNSAELAARLDKIAFPVLTAKSDLRLAAAMVIAVLDLLTHGREYAKMCIANELALAESLHIEGCKVFHVSGKGFTNSQHLALPAATYGGGDTASKLLEKSNLFTSGIGFPCLLFRETLTRCGWVPRELHVGECARKIWKRLPTFFAACC